MVYYMTQMYFPYAPLRRVRKLSERDIANACGLSRSSVRKIGRGDGNITVESLQLLAAYFDREVHVLISPSSILSDYSSIAAAYKVERDGFDSWKIHFFDFVDEFRRTLDPRLIMLPPHRGLDLKHRALLASIVRELTGEAAMRTPSWALARYFLDEPWFISEVESLKASAILEAPLAYRTNNIFVQENFLSRA